uniref:hypothetical protein n=1 Tax=Paenibacillus peoriae TaxID=59893 RepID=UPI00215B213D|nr:hypothetical protein [Paenibacillus peoriae]
MGIYRFVALLQPAVLYGKLHQGSHSRTTVLKLAKAFANRHTWKRMEYRIALLE